MNQETRFEQLAQRWRRETCFHSMPHGIMDNDPFREIVSMGEPAIPLILADRGMYGLKLV